jgi:predicted membrane-bound mannosyltransferase
MRKSSFLQPALLALVLLIGLLVRVVQFPHLPAGINQDEAASAYEAFSLAETGHDKWGNALPAYFPGWGSGQNVLLAYLTVPVVQVLGLNVLSARLVSLVLGLLTLPLFYASLRPLGRYPALFGTLLLALVPWHFLLSRWALESNLVPFFMLLGCFMLVKALSTQRRRWIVPALLPFALSLYAYGTTAVVLPLMLGLVLALCWRQVRPQWGSWLLALGLFGVVATPFAIFFSENYLAGRNFAWTDGLFFATPLLPSTRLGQIGGGDWLDIVQHNMPFLLTSFDDGISHNLLTGFKPLLSITLPFALVGLVVGTWKLVRRRGHFVRSPQNITLLVFTAWGLASLVLFGTVELNINRFNHFYLPCLVLATWGLAVTINSFLPSVPRRALQLAAVAWLALESGLAIDYYFTEYRNGPIKALFNEGLGEAFGALDGLWGIDQVRITDQMPLPYVYTLFYLRYPPAQFQREAQVRVIDGIYRVRRFGRYAFVDDELAPGRPYGYLARKNELADTPQRHRQIIFTNDAWEVGIMQPTAAK